MLLRLPTPHVAGRPVAQIRRTASTENSRTTCAAAAAGPSVAVAACLRSSWRVPDSSRKLTNLAAASLSKLRGGSTSKIRAAAGTNEPPSAAGATPPAPAATAAAVPAGSVSVSFRLTRQCAYGQKYYVSGEHAVFGEWVLEKAIPAEWAEGHVWTATAVVPRSASLPFKFVMVGKRGEVEWQQGGNHCLDTTAVGAVIEVDVPWSTGEALVISNVEDLEPLSAATSPAAAPAASTPAPAASTPAATPAPVAAASTPPAAATAAPAAAVSSKPLVAVPPLRPAPMVAVPPARPAPITTTAQSKRRVNDAVSAPAAAAETIVAEEAADVAGGAAAAAASEAAGGAAAGGAAADGATVGAVAQGGSGSSVGTKEAAPKQRKAAKPRTRRPRAE